MQYYHSAKVSCDSPQRPSCRLYLSVNIVCRTHPDVDRFVLHKRWNLQAHDDGRSCQHHKGLQTAKHQDIIDNLLIFLPFHCIHLYLLSSKEHINYVEIKNKKQKIEGMLLEISLCMTLVEGETVRERITSSDNLIH